MHAKISFNSRQSFIKQLQALEPDVTSLGMSALRLGDLSIEEIELLLSIIPETVLYLNLGTNRLHNMTGDDLGRFFAGIAKTNVRFLSLHHNGLGSMVMKELLQAFSMLSKKLIALDLSYSEFWRKTSEEWKLILATIPSSVIGLNLSGCNFMLTHGIDLAQKLAIVPPGVRRLSLALNQLGEQKGTDLAEAFKAIPSTVNVLDLQKNALHRLSVDKLNLLIGTLPFITTIYLKSGEINRMSSEQLDALAKILPNSQHVIIKNRAHHIVTSEKINYLQSKIKPCFVHTPFQLEKTNQLFHRHNKYMARFLFAKHTVIED